MDITDAAGYINEAETPWSLEHLQRLVQRD
jgi:hypothetical protein